MSTTLTPVTIPLAQFLDSFSDALCTTTANQLTPQFSPAVLEEAIPTLRQFGEPLLPAQANVAAALAYAFRNQPSAICSAEMSTGKTRISTAVAALLKSKRTLVFSPPHLVGKWKAEIETLLPGVQATILRSITDVIQFASLPTVNPWPLFGILSRERSKLSFAKRPALIPKAVRLNQESYTHYHCPQCGTRVDNKDGIPQTPRSLKPGAKCNSCHTPLWTYNPSGPRRIALADYIGKKHPRLFDLLLVDEVQEEKGLGSAQGLAFALLVQKCRRALALTGTLTSGKATSIFHILWRMNPALKASFKHTDEPRWVDLMGTWETRTTEEDVHRVLVVGKESKRRVHVSLRERPGISPHIIPHLVSQTAFLQLRDLGISLPPYREHVQESQLDSLLTKNYTRLTEAARRYIPIGRRTKDGHLVSSFIQALLAYPDRAAQGELITDRNGSICFQLDPLPETVILPKEQALIEYILHERSRGRRVLIYCTHTQTKDITGRLHRLLSNAGIRSLVMTSKVRPERRMKWITDRTKEGLDGLICNPKLVSTGLDLIEYASIAWMEVDYSTYLVRQASRRSWRIKQTEPVDVRFFLYKGTVQEHAWALVAAGINAALQTEGDLLSEGLNLYQQPDDMMTQLIKHVLDRNASVLSAETMFAKLAIQYEHDQKSLTPEPQPLSASSIYDVAPRDIPILTPRPNRHSARLRDADTQLNLFAA